MEEEVSGNSLSVQRQERSFSEEFYFKRVYIISIS